MDVLMMPTVADLHPTHIEGTIRQFAKEQAAVRVQNTHLKIGLGLSLVAVVALVGFQFRQANQLAHVKPVIVRIDEIGRHDVVDYDVATAKFANANWLRRDLTTFVTKHYSRMRGSLRRDFPDSLYFLEAKLADRTMRDAKKALDTFMTTPGTDETDVYVKQVKLVEITTLPYRAEVDFEQQYYQPGTREARRKPELFTVYIDFSTNDTVPTSFVPINPLGLQIANLRVEQAFPTS